MQWYLILLIAFGAILAFLVAIFLLNKFTKPRFKNAKEYLSEQKTTAQVVKQEEKKVVPIGLNLDGNFGRDEEIYYQQEEKEKDNIEDIDFDSFNFNREKRRRKSLAEQIRELSPELKILLFDRGLARKDYEFKSKKD